MNDARPSPDDRTAPRGAPALLVSESVVLGVVLLNAAALLLMSLSPPGSPAYRTFFAVDYACIVYFVVEASLKIGNRGWRVYWTSGWNRFDFLVTVLSLPALLAPIWDLHHFSAILLLRLGRLFRLFRLFVFLPDINRLAGGVARALRASVGVFIALLLINVIFGLGATFLFRELAPEHFGSPFMSGYSLFKVFTVEGWYEIPDLLAERASPAWAVVARAYFIIAVVIGGLLGLSLANAVFVDEMMRDNTLDLEAKVESLTGEVRALRLALEGGEARAPGGRPPEGPGPGRAASDRPASVRPAPDGSGPETPPRDR